MIYSHHSDYRWPVDRWPNFSGRELACPCCGELYVDEASLDMIQAARSILGRPMRINSAHRCHIHNAKVGGARASQHLKIAFDISIRGQDPGAVLLACREAGFTTFGFYRTFFHTDIRPGRRWATNGGRETWKGLTAF